MKSMKRYFLLAFLVIASTAARSFEVKSQNSETLISDYLQAYVKLGRLSGSILIMKDDKIIVNKGYGFANYELQAKNTPQTKFRVGSVTKQFTALAIIQLEEKGLLSTDDHINKYLPDYPNGDKITIHHLLTHTSGIPSFTSFRDFKKESVLPATPLQTIDRFKNKELLFPPGTNYKYSDSDYILLGYIMEKVTGKTYQEYLSESIFKPLNMSNTNYDNPKLILKNRASGYVYEDGILYNADYNDMSVPFAAGALFSTTEDLYKWDRALYKNVLVTDSSLKKIFTPYMKNYGYGWFIDDFYSHKRIWHHGYIDGFCSIITRFVDDDICIVILSNLINTPILQITNDIAAILFDKPYRDPDNMKTIKIDEELMNDYVGTYEITPNFRIDIKTLNRHLFSQATGQGTFELFPKDKDRFFTVDFESEMTFQRDNNGEVTALIIHQNNNDTKAKRIAP
jgi:CubicO group peptidase (beta-lactamase class C family)